MSHVEKYVFLFLLILAGILGPAASGAYAAEYKVLVIMSYHETMPWVKEIKEGIDSVLQQPGFRVHYFYMDTRNHPNRGFAKAQESYALFQSYRPDGVIAADDNAQSLFVVPFLKDKVKTPVIFCGVNAEPGIYGYPASNVTGVLERAHTKESIALIQQLVPSVQTIGYLAQDSPTGKRIFEVLRKESETYSAKSAAFQLAGSLQDAVKKAKRLSKSCDALFLVALEGLLGPSGEQLSEKDVIPVITKAFGKPTTSPDEFNIRIGALCAVSKSGREQGRICATMLLKALEGTPVSKLPITRNYLGKRVINISVMQDLGIKPNPHALIGSELIKTE